MLALAIIVGVVFLIFVNVSVLYMEAKLEKVGFRFPYLASFRQHRQRTRDYRRLRKAKGWPLWPVVLHYLSFPLGVLYLVLMGRALSS